MTAGAMKASHPTDIHPRVGVTFDAVLSLRVGGMEGREVARKTVKVGSNDVNIVPSSVSDLRPLCRLV